MAKKAVDRDQMALDLEDAQLRLTRLRCAILARDELRDKLRHLRGEVGATARKLKEAEWNVAALLSQERRKGDAEAGALGPNVRKEGT